MSALIVIVFVLVGVGVWMAGRSALGAAEAPGERGPGGLRRFFVYAVLLATLILAAGVFGRPYVLSPNTPADRVNIVREAFAKAMKDEAVLADAQKKKLEIDPTFGEELEALAKEVSSQPAEIVERMRKMLGK